MIADLHIKRFKENNKNRKVATSQAFVCCTNILIFRNQKNLKSWFKYYFHHRFNYFEFIVLDIFFVHSVYKLVLTNKRLANKL